MKRFSAAAAVAFFSVVTGAARAEDFVVINSSVAAIAAGATVNSGATLAVPAKGRVVLVAASGRVVTINGPFHGAPPDAASAASGAPSGDVVQIIATLVGQGDRRQVLGAVRGTDAAWRQDATKTLADVLTVDATDGGDVCLYDAMHAMVVHNPSHDGTMAIEPMNGGAKAELDWPKATVSQPWPSALPIGDGEGFLFEQAGASGAAVATIHLLPENGAASDVERVLQMARTGCSDQAKLLVALIAQAAK